MLVREREGERERERLGERYKVNVIHKKRHTERPCKRDKHHVSERNSM